MNINIEVKKMNKISVVLMVYNRKEFYKEALDSLKEQSDRDFELIIVSNIPIDYDLSAFKEVNIIPAPVDSHEEYVVGRSPSNLLESYIAGMEAAKNNIVAFLDDDDKFVSYKISFLRSSNIAGYYHNNYYDFGSKEPHNTGKGFNCSCIAVNKSAYNGILPIAKDYPLLKGDSSIYWYALEHNLPIQIDHSAYLTFYRHKPMKKLYANLPDSLNRQMKALEEAGKVFKSEKVRDIIREGTIQNQLYLNSLGYYKKIPLYDMFWLMGRPVIQKKAKLVSYLLSLPVWHGMGIALINSIRNKKVVENDTE